jgi:hypothetical protein
MEKVTKVSDVTVEEAADAVIPSATEDEELLEQYAVLVSAEYNNQT